MRTIGIDAVAIAVPEGFVELADLAEARGVPAGKYVEGLGVTRMAVARAPEDPVALAANAARRLFALGEIDPSRIAEVRGMADRNLRVPTRPNDPANRRISILLPFSVQLGEQDPAESLGPDASVVKSSS